MSVDSSFTPLFLGGHHQPRSRDDLFNDNVSCIALRATSKHFAVDNKEISRARWFPISLLAAAADDALARDVRCDM